MRGSRLEISANSGLCLAEHNNGNCVKVASLWHRCRPYPTRAISIGRARMC